MEIILLQDTRNLGKRGEIVDVKPGYARNFLLPSGAALESNKGNLAFFEQQRVKIDLAHSKALEEAQVMAAQIGEIRIKVSKRVGESGTLYGSVTATDVVSALADKGVKVAKRQIDLGAPSLKTLGEHSVQIDVHPEVDAEVIVEIVPAE